MRFLKNKALTHFSLHPVDTVKPRKKQSTTPLSIWRNDSIRIQKLYKHYSNTYTYIMHALLYIAMYTCVFQCCGVDAYTLSDDNVLCCNGILRLNVPEQSECVGGVIYTPGNTTCQMSTRPRLGEHCCGGQTFNPRTHICCNGHR